MKKFAWRKVKCYFVRKKSNETFLLIFKHCEARASKQSGQKHIWGSLKLAGEH